MYSSLLVLVLFLTSKSLGAFVINVDDFFNNTAADDELVDVEGLLKGFGYPFESHEATTDDGYILTIHRIPYGKDGPPKNSEDTHRPAVLIMHGMLSSSVDFFLLGPERSLALKLADEGYDVWLGNNRGNTWSRKHLTLDPDADEDFWDFSFHELGFHDTPAIIDYILTTTGNEQLSYIGHSRGATQFFVMASTKPEYNDKVTIMSALAPATYSKHLPNPIVQLAKDFYDIIDLAVHSLNFNELLPHYLLLSIAKDICSVTSEYQEICATVFFLLGGFDSDQLDRALVPLLVQSVPAGTSFKDLQHYLQLVKSDHFRQFDYGEETNLKVYGKPEPPDYNIAYITAPVGLYYAENDWLVATADVDRLAEELPNVAEKHLIEYPYFTHLDFIFATDVATLSNNYVIDLVEDYNGENIRTRPTAPPIDDKTPTGVSDSTESPTTKGSASVMFSWIQVFCSSLLIVVLKLLM